MKTFKKIVVVIVAVVALAFVIGLFLPRNVELSRSISMEANCIDSAFHLVNDLQKWDLWSPWHDIDPSTTWEYNGENAVGVGAWYRWSGKEVGKGKLTITKVNLPLLIDTYMEFEGAGDANAQFIFNKEVSPATITWTFSTDIGFNPFARYFAPFIESQLGPQYERGLKRLKEVVQKNF